MAISQTKSVSKEQGKATSTFKKKKLIHKSPTDAECKTIKKEKENVDLGMPLICYKRRSLDRDERSALDRANDVQDRLVLDYPSLVKPMVRSHVSSCFWLGLPKKFCDKHMPKKDVTTFVLEDETGQEYGTSYLWERTGLSGGWRGFAMKHNLVEGDVLVFQLIEPCKFKVYICRRNGNGSGETDMNLDVKPLQNAVEDASVEKIDEMETSVCDELDETFEGITFCDEVVEFKDVKTLADFKVVVDGLVIDSEIPAQTRARYYNMCVSQENYLHNHLIDGINCNLAAGAIIEAVYVSEAMRAAKMTTPSEELRKWDISLKLCEDMGMELGFLRKRLNNMIGLHSEQTRMIQMKISERVKVEQEMKNHEAELVKVEGDINNVDEEIRVLKVEISGHKLAFSKVANAAW